MENGFGSKLGLIMLMTPNGLEDNPIPIPIPIPIPNANCT